MGEKGTSVRSLSECEGDSTEREVICGVKGRSEAAPEPPGEEALELGPWRRRSEPAQCVVSA